MPFENVSASRKHLTLSQKLSDSTICSSSRSNNLFVSSSFILILFAKSNLRMLACLYQLINPNLVETVYFKFGL